MIRLVHEQHDLVGMEIMQVIVNIRNGKLLLNLLRQPVQAVKLFMQHHDTDGKVLIWQGEVQLRTIQIEVFSGSVGAV